MISEKVATFEGTPDIVFEQFEKVREEGQVNTVSRISVQRVADEHGFFNLVIWLEDVGRDGYTDFLQAFCRWKEQQSNG